ncbi:glycosyltransferase [Gillisia limnaea]|uniref:Glycosyl transferase group 1 n=1 Tax=Gillisia limnaea (strain DSM 15749 / LMG 21470 / R-8282) TaxID=865937 RepID=H2BRS9_GILLR|nr:glycosyltransferase [Gillisia limnaea]EHQ01394.1 glycosyl transferase group 1 [Gillisia limnaea DSM 15749]
MRILQIIQQKQYRGAEIFACQLSSHLMNLGNEVEIVSIYDGDALLPFKNEIPTLSNQDSNRYLDLQGWKKLADIIEGFKPDIIQANAADTLKYAVFSKLIYRWKAPIVYRNASTTSYYIKNHFSKFINSFLLFNVDRVISVSHASKRDLNKVFPFTKNKTVVVPIGIDPIKTAETAIAFSPRRSNIIHVGSFTREKNHKGLLSIFKKLTTLNQNYFLHLIGEGPLRNVMEEEVHQLDLIDSVKFYEGVRNPLPYISAADILVLPSNIEGLPAVLLEAMFCKTPVVAYNVGGISEIVSSQTGSLIEKDDEDNFVNAVLKTLGNPDFEQIETAHKMVIKDYMNKEIAKKFVEVYEAVAPQPPKGE